MYARAGDMSMWNYPRSRGEKFLPVQGLELATELPPLARGKARAAAQPLRGSGITPARAGKSINFLSIQGIYQNYPRSRGEKSTTIFSPACTRELPPLARGKAQRSTLVQVGDRITPARAGKRASPCGRECRPRNYPRSRGEKHSVLLRIGGRGELPPLARGKARGRGLCHPHIGITPARAGKRAETVNDGVAFRNYPRSRGEKSEPIWVACSCLELPPLARGKDAASSMTSYSSGITPARAGKRA